MNSLFEISDESQVSFAQIMSGFDVSMVSDRDSRFDMRLWQLTDKIRRLFLRFRCIVGFGDELVMGDPMSLDCIDSEVVSSDSLARSSKLF